MALRLIKDPSNPLGWSPEIALLGSHGDFYYVHKLVGQGRVSMVARLGEHAPPPVSGIGVAAELVGEEKAPPPRRQKFGPKSQLEQVVDRVLGLPRREQERVLELLEDAVTRAEQRAT